MNITCILLICCLASASLSAQYYFTGEVKDPHGDKLQNGVIIVQSTQAVYKTGAYGEFQIRSALEEDSLLLVFDGYKPLVTAVSAKSSLSVILEKADPSAPSKKNRLRSVCKPTSVSFAGPVSLSSYPMIRKLMNMGGRVPPEAVQIEEILNYFDQTAEEDPEKEKSFDCSSDLLTCPWNARHEVLFWHVQAPRINVADMPPCNFVFLIDASGSMDLPNKMPIFKAGIRLLIQNLRREDTISVVTFGLQVRTLLQGVPGSAKARILYAIDAIEPDGSTPGADGMRLAYTIAGQQFIPGGKNRVILVTDGDINSGAAGQRQLEEWVRQQSQHGISLSCLGVGLGNTENSQLLTLASSGQGDFAVATDEQDAEKLLSRQLSPSLSDVADHICISAAFNPALVKSYRLIGFENKEAAREDTSIAPEGGPMGSGQSLLALFELVPTDDSSGRAAAAIPEAEIANMELHYGLPDKKGEGVIHSHCPGHLMPFERARSRLQRAACVALFGMKLRESKEVAQLSWATLEKMTKKYFAGSDARDKEYVELVNKAKKIYR
ncbi:MAG TPA: von Willebrand factor type A domain-containing protein [Puia sp.]|nr:von Willebrand factor type A domain-containing protein [Puia sp.]